MKKVTKIFLLTLFLLQSAFAETTSEDVTSDLGWAIIKKDTPKAIKLIKDGADLLFYENENSIKKIVTPSVTTTYIGGMESNAYPPIILAAVSGQDEIIKAIIAKDKEAIYLKDMDGNDALMWASREGHLSTVKLLLEYGFDPLYVAGEFSAYELALNKGKHKIVELYIDKLIAENRTDIFPYTIWRLARGDGNLIEKLLKLGVKDSYKGVAPKTSLMKAAEVGNLETMKLLIKYGSDPYEANERSTRYGYDPLTAAVNSGQEDVVRYLLENYDYDLSKLFNVNNPQAFAMQKVLAKEYGMKLDTKIAGDNYLHIAYNRYNKPKKETFLLLLKKSQLDINSLNSDGDSLLQEAVAGADVEYVKFFLGLGLSENTIKGGRESAKRYLDIYEKQYKQVENTYNLKNMENARKIYSLVEKKLHDLQ